MEKIIHTPNEIVVGKLYKVKSKAYHDHVLYLGAIHHTSIEKFLIIVIDDACGLIGNTVIPPNDSPTNFWTLGFIEQDTTH